MSKIILIIKREYLTRVMKKSFLLTTILVPLLIAGFYAAILAITTSGSNEKKREIAIVDEGALFNNRVDSIKSNLSFKIIEGMEKEGFRETYKSNGYDALLYIPPFSVDSPGTFALYSPQSLDLSTISAIEDEVNNAIIKKRLGTMGISMEMYKSISASVSIENKVEIAETGKSRTNVAEIGYGVSYVCGILIYMMMLIYGTQVMRGVMEEKTSRISEVMISSIRPFQLMMGKILGIGAVGLTQFSIWIILIFGLSSIIPLLLPGTMDVSAQMPAGSNTAAINEIMAGISELPLAKIVFCFIFYFLGGYLTYASLFAAIGSVAGEDQQETQQLVFPIMMPIILGFVIMQQATNDPYSSLARFGSYFPLTSPIVMMGRISFDIPWWELMISMILLAGSFVFFTWIAGRIYRTGILMYGKKPSWKEMLKWAFRRN